MKTIKIMIAGALCLLLLSCSSKKADLTITNKVPNVQLQKVSFNDREIATKLLPGETSKATTFVDRWDNVDFPLTSIVKFYMVKGDSKVLLQTKASFTLNEDETLDIVIDANTEVVNPMD